MNITEEDFPTPVAMAQRLQMAFSEDQAVLIAAEIYQPMRAALLKMADNWSADAIHPGLAPKTGETP